MPRTFQTSLKSFTTAILCQKSRNRDTISTKMQRRRRSRNYSGEETRCVPADSTQRAAQDASEVRQAANPSRKQQGPGNKPQSSKPPRSVRHSRRRREYRPTAGRIGPTQSKPKSKPHLPFSPKPDRLLRPPWPESALRADRIGLHWFAAANNRSRQ